MVSEKRLKSFPAFGALPSAALKGLAGAVSEESFASGAVIFPEGKWDNAVYFVASGEVLIRKAIDKAKGTSKMLALLGAGEFFGEMALLEGAPRSAEAVAQGDVLLFKLPGAEFNRILKKNPKVALELFRRLVVTLSARLRRTTREMVVFFEVGRILASLREVRALAGQLLSQTLSIFEEDDVAGAFYVWNEFNREFDPLAFAGPWPDANRHSRPVDDPLMAWIQKNRSFMLSGRWGEDTRFPDAAKGSWPPFRSLIVSPILGGQGVSAFMAFGHARKADCFTSDHCQVVCGVAHLASPAFENALLRQEEECRRRLGRSRLSADF